MRVALAVVLVALPAFAQSWVEDCGLEPPGKVYPPVPRKPFEPLATSANVPIVRRELPEAHRLNGWPTAHLVATGALSGKAVYVSPGHGFTWDDGATAWRTQRGTNSQIVEDLVSTETVNQFLVPMLLNAGARVVEMREADLNPAMVVVDNGEAGYVESGAGFSTSSLAGWGRPPGATIDGATNLFALGSNRLMSVAATPTASASYTATLPSDGYYTVYISYTEFTARVTDAHFIVHHSGGDTHFRINQQRHGSTWVLLGRFYFRASSPAQVIVQNDSAAASTSNISLDAVRFGGGMGMIDRGGGASGRPRFEESARYQAQFAGAPLSVYAPSSNTPADDRNNDVGTRSRFTAWVHEPGEDAIYFAWHTNASGIVPDTITGTETYVYGPNPPNGTLATPATFTGVAGGIALANAVHAEFLNDVRASAGWNTPGWLDRHVQTAYFGEINPANNSETPAILMEVAFHDTPADAARLKEPGFRYLAARAITQGMIKYFAAKDAVAVHLPPEPPTHVSAVSQSGTQALLRWHAPGVDSQGVSGDAAVSYRVYSSADGLGWDDGVPAATTSTTMTIDPSVARFFRVTAINAGGESFPSAVVGVRAPPAGMAKALVVNAYDRLEASIGQMEQFPTTYALGSVLRIFILRMNDGSYVRMHGEALSALDVGFDSATVEAVNAGDVTPGGYALVSWFAGRGHAAGAAPTASEQALISGAISTNTPVIFTGAATGAPAFLANPLMAATAAGTATQTVTGAGPLAGLTLTLDDSSGGAYDTGTADVVTPTSGAIALGNYAGLGAGSGVAHQVAYLAFPFETITSRPLRIEVMRRLIGFLQPAGIDAGVGDGGTGGGSAGGTGGGSAGGTGGGSAGGSGGGVAGGSAGGTAGGSGGGGGSAGGTGGGTGGGVPETIAFEGGGCSAAPTISLLISAAAWLVLRRRSGTFRSW